MSKAHQYSFLLSLSNLNVFILDQSMEVKFVSAGVEELLGFDSDELVGRSFDSLFDETSRKLCDAFLGLLKQYNSAQEPKIIFRKKNGRKMYLNLGGTLSPGKENAEYIINAVDISTTIKLLDQLQKANEGLEKKVEERTAQLAEANTQLEDLALTDVLTGLRNRRFFQTSLHREIESCRRYEKEMSVVLIDVDHFKIYNDKNGHLAGDEALQTIGAILTGQTSFSSGEKVFELHPLVLRESDYPATRYGGEEFALILPNTSQEGALTVASRICEAIRKSNFEYGHNQPLGYVSASVGVASFPQNGSSSDEILKAADDALYKVKESDRDGFSAPLNQ